MIKNAKTNKFITGRIATTLFLPVIVFLIAGCNQPSESSSLDISTFGADLQRILPLLASTDEFQVRHAIADIPLTHDSFAAPLLEALWKGEAITGLNIEPEILQSPIVRSRIAQGLIGLGHEDPEYIDYIRQLIVDDNQTIVIVGLEALRDIDNKETIKLLADFSSNSHPKIAEIAIAGVRHHVDYGRNKQYASQLWMKIKEDPAVNQSIVNEYEKMYSDYKESVSQ